MIFGTEQGFAGAFSERAFATIGVEPSASEVFLIGSHGESIAAERGIAADWNAAMPSHSPGVPLLAERIVDALYTRIAAGQIDSLDAVFSQWRAGALSVERRRLFPIDYSTVPRNMYDNIPLLYLPAEVFLDALGADYMHVLICHAALHAFAAQNEARMVAMAAARNRIEREVSTLQGEERRVRQAAITAEILELAAGRMALDRK